MKEEMLKGIGKINQLSLTQEERRIVLDFFAFLAGEEEALESCNTDDIERMVHLIPLKNVLREDVSIKTFSRDSLLVGAPKHTDGYWQVPRVVD